MDNEINRESLKKGLDILTQVVQHFPNKKQITPKTEVTQMANARATQARTPNPVMVRAGIKAARTRRINALEREYQAARTPGVKAGLRKRINAILRGE